MSDSPEQPPPPRRPPQAPRARPMVLFGLLTILTFLGPLLIVVVGRGGDRPSWPPDRPVEWWVLIGVVVVYLVLLSACLLDASMTLRKQREEARRRDDPEARS